MNNPVVSVIVPNYNHRQFLRPRLDSIFQQTFSDFEVILLDDASTDDSRSVLDEYRQEERVAACVYNARNSGSPFSQWNRGAALARGKYFWIAESDDVAHPRFLAEMVARLEACPSVGISYCQSDILNEQGQVVGSTLDYYRPLGGLARRWETDFVADGPEECARFMPRLNTIPNASAALLRRSVWHEAGGADEARRLNGDHKLWCGMLLHSDVAFAATAWNGYRRHGGTVRAATYQSGQMMEEAYSFLQWLETRTLLDPAVREAALDELMDQWTTWAILFGLRGRAGNRLRYIARWQHTLDKAPLTRFLRRATLRAKAKLHRPLRSPKGIEI